MNKKHSILIIDQFDLQILDELREHFTVDHKPAITHEELSGAIGNYNVLVISTRLTIDRNILQRAVNCSLIVRLGSGVDHIDLQTCHKMSITVCNTPLSNVASVVELVFGQLVSCYRTLATMQKSILQGSFRKGIKKGSELYGKTIGIIGTGRIGSAIARIAKAYGMITIGYDPFLSESQKSEKDIDLWASSNEELISQSNIVTLHVPLTKETIEMAGKSFFSNMQQGFIFINTARGKCVVFNDLIMALQLDKLAAAIIDVFPEEPFTCNIPDDLINRLFLSPHAGAYTKEALLKRSNECIIEINEFYAGNTPHGNIDLEKGY